MPIDTTPTAALRAELARANGIVAYLAARCRELPAAELARCVHEVRTSPDGITTVYRAAPNVWLVLLRQWSAYVAEIAATMSRLDLSAREIGMAEAYAVALDRALAGAGVGLGQRVKALRLLPGELDASGA